MLKAATLKFAALIRVSTDKQEQQGESLRTQTKQTNTAVASLDAQVVKTYAGQEHATAGYERQLLDQLLADAAKPNCSFNAVMVADPSRWSRDNAASETGLRILRERGIRFFSLTTEYDLFDPQQILFLSLNSVIGAFHAATQKQKSLLNRIERAKRGIPTSGKLPFGRIWNKTKEKWGIDPAKHAMIKDVARRYLDGESLAALAEEYHVNHATLHKTLMHRCGSTWEVKFKSPDLNIDETVTINIPRLLPENIIKALRERAEAHKTYQAGHPKHEYLLGGFVFCENCGYSLFGQLNQHGRFYYRHAHTKRERKCDIKPLPWVPRDGLDKAVIERLFETFGNPVAVQRAIEQAQPNREKIARLRERQERIQSSLDKLAQGKKKVLDLVGECMISDEDAREQLTTLKRKVEAKQKELNRVESELGSFADAKLVERVSKRAQELTAKYRPPLSSARLWAQKYVANSDIDAMTYAEARKLVQTVFQGRRPDGKPNGVYVERVFDKNNKKRWRFTLYGNLVDGKAGVLADSRR